MIFLKGCYKDSYVRDLNGLYINFTNNTVEVCVPYCQANYFKYAGLQG